MKMGCSVRHELNGKLIRRVDVEYMLKELRLQQAILQQELELANLKLRLIRVKSERRKEESPYLTAKASQIQEQDSPSAESSSIDGLTTVPKMVINSPCLKSKKELAIPEQTTTGKESTNPLMADSLPKTIMPTKLVKPQDFNLRPNLGIQTPTKTKDQTLVSKQFDQGIQSPKMVGKPYYVVFNGHYTGIYEEWQHCRGRSPSNSRNSKDIQALMYGLTKKTLFLPY
ncbi:retrotransposon protein, putative, ty3-gypsy subclass [Tanacetum coccineum]